MVGSFDERERMLMGLMDWFARGRNLMDWFARGRNKDGGVNGRRRDRIRGALLGVHAGDSLGATTEFMTPARVRRQYGQLRDIVGGGVFGWSPGDATDDTDLTKAVLDGYRDASDGRTPAEAAGARMVAWARRGPRDIGGTTASALQRFEQTGNTWGGNAGDSSAANGSLMRCIPTALVRANDPKLRRDETREISSITHAERRTVDACVAYNEMVSALVNGAEPSQAVDEALRVCKEENLDPRVEVAIRQGRRIDLEASEQLNEWVFRGREPVTDWHDGGGYVLDSLAIGVAAVEDPRGPEAALISVVNMGGDADTNGAIAGGLLGAAYGESALPERWTECLQFGEEFRRAGDAITDGRFLPEDDDAVRSAAAEVETAADRTVPTGEYVRAAHDRVDPRTGRTVRVRSHRVQRRSGC